MSKQESYPTHLQSEISEQLITMFEFAHPQLFSHHLDKLFLAWNLSDEADDVEMRESVQLTVQMLKDFFFLFSKEEPENVALLLKSNIKLIEHAD